MSKKKEEQLAQAQKTAEAARQAAAPQSGYSTADLNSRSDVQNALAGAEYRPSQNVTDAANDLKQWQQNRPGQYQSAYQDKMDELMDALLGRDSFQYSYAQDPLYRQYAQLYTQNAANASADAAAQAAALTGGYGSSYAASVAQQAYQQQIGALSEAIPTLYRLALDTYTGGGEELVTKLDQLGAREQNDQNLYNNELADYYTQLQQKGDAYNAAYAQDYGQYQDYLNRLDTLYGYYAAQEQQAASRKQEKFNRTMKVLGFLGDVVQLAITGTTGLGTLAGNLANSRYNRAASERAYADSRADTAWEQRMKELQRQDSLTQQQYKNELAEREYQDTLRQQQFSNDLASEKLDIAKGEWALKQSKAAQSARQASTNASAKAESGLSGSGLTAGKSGVSSGTLVPYSAARLRSQGRSDSAIRNELLKEGYSSEEVKSIMKQMNSRMFVLFCVPKEYQKSTAFSRRGHESGAARP